jgi:HD-GYP domain-containing protein (c-di-GMP phosphodiesterase class II)
MEDIRQGKRIKMERAYSMMDAMETSIDSNRDALMYLMRIRKKDEYTMMHSINVGVLILTMTTLLGLKREARLQLAMGGLLHDVGKVKVPDQILKKPEKLSTEEFMEMQRHALYSKGIFATSREVPPEAIQMALQHHERIDGSGYPFGLKGTDIGIAAQMTAVADVYDALTADRCYRDGVSPIDGLRFIYSGCGTHFNRKFAHFFIKAIGVYPVGSFVRLESGLIGIVVGSNRDLLRPVVRVFYNEARGWPVALKDIDLAKPLGQGGGDRIVGHETKNRWKVDPLRLLR